MDNSEQTYRERLGWKLEQLKAEIRGTQKEIQEKTETIKAKQEQVEHVLKLLEAEGIPIDRTELDGIIPIPLSEIAAKILRNHKTPMHYKELTEAIQETGHKIQGQNPAATVIALLHRKKDEFVRLDSGVWGLKEWGSAPQELVSRGRKKRRRRARSKSG